MKLRYGISTFALVIGSALVVPSCGGSSTSNGDDPACADGATRSCVGPGACEGGQMCRSGSWSDCLCGSTTGGSNGQGGATPGVGGTGTWQAGSGGTGTSQAGSAGHAGHDCPPPEKLLMDCSGDCAADKPCTATTCNEALTVHVPAVGEWYVRTGNARERCRCDVEPWAKQMLTLALLHETGRLQISCSEPWRILRYGANANGFCSKSPGDPNAPSGTDFCDLFSTGLPLVSVGVDTSGAPPTNIRILAGPSAIACE
jgi:hypothetical protein